MSTVKAQSKRTRQEADAHQSNTPAMLRSIVASGTPLSMSPSSVVFRTICEVDEQPNKSARWLHAHGCSPSQHWKATAGAIGTRSCDGRTKGTIPGQRSSSIPEGSTGSPRSTVGTRQVRARYSLCPRRTTSLQQEELLARVRLVRSEAQDWKSRVVSEAEQVLVANLQEQHDGPPKYKKPWTSNFKSDGEKQDQLRDTHEPNSAQAQQLAASLQRSELEHQQLHTANERRLQLEAQALRATRQGAPSPEHGTPERIGSIGGTETQGSIRSSTPLISFSLPKTRSLLESIYGLSDLPDGIGLHNVHLDQDGRWGGQDCILIMNIYIEERTGDINT